MKKEYPVVKTKWINIAEPNYKIEVKCPNNECKQLMNNYDFQYYPSQAGGGLNGLIFCPHCNTKFKLEVEKA
jgi:hypothetical protein